MCRIISVTNQKGGVGKTTSTVSLGIGLARKGYRVCLIDNDPQGDLSASLGIRKPDEIKVTLATLLTQVIQRPAELQVQQEQL